MAGWQHLEEVDHSSGTGRGRERGSAKRRHKRTRAREDSAAATDVIGNIAESEAAV